jgi:hypothetical protein
MYGEMTDKTTVSYLEQCLDAHSMEQFEILLYKKTRKINHLLSPHVRILLSRLIMFRRSRVCIRLFHACMQQQQRQQQQ